MTVTDSTTPAEKLQALLAHHYTHHVEEHGNVLPFIDLYIDDNRLMQISFSRFNLTGSATADQEQAFQSYVESASDVTYSEEMGVPEGRFPIDDWDDERVYKHVEEVLGELGFEMADLTHAVETDCPTNADPVDWETVSGTSSASDRETVADPRSAITRLYTEVAEREEDTNGVPTPFPSVRFYVEDEALSYLFGPAMHKLEQPSSADRTAFDEIVESTPELEVTSTDSDAVSVAHHDWTPEEAVAVTESVLSEVFDRSLEEITYAELSSSHPDDPLSWADV
jgi:hypothetical protein